MRSLSPAGRKAIDSLAQQHGFSQEAVSHMLEAVVAGRGSMAQFNHPEFGGSGQWMRGGMIMLSDMFNTALKARIDGLCNDLADLATTAPELASNGGRQMQSQQGSFGQQQQSGDSDPGSWNNASLFVTASESSAAWWGADLGRPASAGAQNGLRYAYFPEVQRLAIEHDGQVTLYDTGDHQISGFSQQQSTGGSLTFTSQQGLVDISRLPVVTKAQPSNAAPASNRPAPLPETGQSSPTPPNSPAPAAPPTAMDRDVFSTIERLADLHAKGVLSAEEFADKKKELLSRI